MAMSSDPIELELFKNAIFSIADEMALTVFRTTYSGVLKDNMDYSTGFADANGKLGGSADHTEIFRYAEMLAEDES